MTRIGSDFGFDERVRRGLDRHEGRTRSTGLPRGCQGKDPYAGPSRRDSTREIENEITCVRYQTFVPMTKTTSFLSYCRLERDKGLLIQLTTNGINI